MDSLANYSLTYLSSTNKQQCEDPSNKKYLDENHKLMQLFESLKIAHGEDSQQIKKGNTRPPPIVHGNDRVGVSYCYNDGFDHKINRNQVGYRMFVGDIVSWLKMEKRLFELRTSGGYTSPSEINFLVSVAVKNRDLFFAAAFDRRRSSEVQKLIKNLKGSGYGSTLTSILSLRFFDLMTHSSGKIIIKACLDHFKYEENDVLYEEAIMHCRKLAIHKVGCISLKECIDTIAGTQKLELLYSIAGFSNYLSNDEYGNFVVQHVLALKDYDVNIMIFSLLETNYIMLAQTKEGSRVVEKCVECSGIGTYLVVKEILDFPDGPFLLAQDGYGNYVIQKAILKTLEYGMIDLFKALVRAIHPRSRDLVCTQGGTRIINLINDAILWLRQCRKSDASQSTWCFSLRS